MRVGLTIHRSSFKDRYFVWSRAKDSPNLNNTINTCLIRLNILYYS